ncbi:MAG: four helix bundle protein [Kiritimatiellae bacterium]|nr:four helix bundle protein [Kiritimatiellia bacterium]
MSGYRELNIYKESHRLGVGIHKFSLKLPKYELYESGAQIRRASKSISANIVEGYGRRRYVADYVRFLTYAQSSCDETHEWITYIHELHRELSDEALQLLKLADTLGRQINVFIQSIESRRSHSRTSVPSPQRPESSP